MCQTKNLYKHFIFLNTEKIIDIYNFNQLNIHIIIGIDWKNCDIEVAIDKQSDEISNGVHRDKHEDDIGAGDQVRTSKNKLIDTVIAII